MARAWKRSIAASRMASSRHIAKGYPVLVPDHRRAANQMVGILFARWVVLVAEAQLRPWYLRRRHSLGGRKRLVCGGWKFVLPTLGPQSQIQIGANTTAPIFPKSSRIFRKAQNFATFAAIQGIFSSSRPTLLQPGKAQPTQVSTTQTWRYCLPGINTVAACPH